MRAAARCRRCCAQLLAATPAAPPPPRPSLRKLSAEPKSAAAEAQPRPPHAPPPPAGDKGQAGTHTAEFFYHPERDAELLQAAADPHGSALRRFLLPVCSAAIAVYIGVHAAPLVGGGSTTHATRLLGAREPFLQRSGCERIALLAKSSDTLAAAAVEGGAVRLLFRLLDTTPDAGVRAAAAAALATLAAAPAGADALRAAPELLSLHALAASKPRPDDSPADVATRASARDALVAIGAITAFAAART